IAGALIDLGHTLGIRVIAERVDSAAQAEFFLQQCDGIQGYHVARPMTADAMESWLKLHSGHVVKSERMLARRGGAAMS
ncbi:MAG: sensor diguanylate cyclase, partial [Xanthomonadaceae bacterium]|nr:sensor diguanylate cyclase [Xanthomonadaceae bacterium]